MPQWSRYKLDVWIQFFHLFIKNHEKCLPVLIITKNLYNIYILFVITYHRQTRTIFLCSTKKTDTGNKTFYRKKINVLQKALKTILWHWKVHNNAFLKYSLSLTFWRPPRVSNNNRLRCKSLIWGCSYKSELKGYLGKTSFFPFRAKILLLYS